MGNTMLYEEMNENGSFSQNEKRNVPLKKSGNTGSLFGLNMNKSEVSKEG
jgi:hypothetical protein